MSRTHQIRTAYRAGTTNPDTLARQYGVKLTTAKTQIHHARKDWIKELIQKGNTDANLIKDITGASTNLINKLLNTTTPNPNATTPKDTCARCGIKTPKSLCPVCKKFGAINVEAKKPWTICKIGADPEFLFYKTGIGMIEASTVLRGHGTHSQVGLDGASSTGEIRPTPADNAVQLTKNVKKCMDKLKTLMDESNHKGLTLICGSGTTNTPIGGHIHFGGINYNTDKTRMYSSVMTDLNSTQEGMAIADQINKTVLKNTTDKLVKCLNMASILLINNQSELRLNRLRRYGKLNDARSQPHGMEYRTPHSWLSTPKEAITTLALHHAIAIEFQNEGVESEALKGLIALHDNTKNINTKYTTGRGMKKLRNQIVKHITQLNVLRSGIFNYREIIMEYLNKEFDKEAPTGIQYIQEADWDMKAVISVQNLFKFNNTDQYLDQIQARVQNKKVKTNHPIRIVGLAEENWNAAVVYSRQITPASITLIKEFLTENSINKETLQVEESRFGGRAIGFSLQLRKDKQEEIAHLLNKIIELEQMREAN